MCGMGDAQAQRNTVGAAYAVGAYLMWGFFPVYWKALSHVSALEVLFHRMLWSMLLLAGLITALRRWPQALAVMTAPRQVLLLTATTSLLAVNWLLFIWAVNDGHVLETSLGYFINPLVNVVLGVIFLGERLRRWQAAAVLLAAAGVLVLTLATGTPPWIALALAGTFGVYGLLRKMSPVEPVTGLLVETGLLAPVALGYLAWTHAGGGGALGNDGWTDALLVLGGAVTAAPLLLFAAAARRLRYATLGLFQYIAPSLHFMLAVAVYGEPLRPAHLVTFACIWAALALYAGESWLQSRKPVETVETVRSG